MSNVNPKALSVPVATSKPWQRRGRRRTKSNPATFVERREEKATVKLNHHRYHLSSALCPVHPELERRTSNESGNSKASSASHMDHSDIPSPAMGMASSIAGDETDADKLHRVQAAQHVRENALAIAE